MITFSSIGYYGKLGNQLFQYAALYGIAKKNGYDYGIPYVNQNHWRNDHGYKSRLFLPEIFNITAKDSTNYKLIQRELGWYQTSFLSELMDIPDNTNIGGYLQSEKYFKHCEFGIRREFSFKNKEKLSKANDFHCSLKQQTETISLHFRRGDFCKHSELLAVCPKDYYRNAVELIENKLGKKCNLLIFSNEIEWCKKEVPLYFPNNTIHYDESSNTDDDYFNDQERTLMRMTLCDHFVIANSSYSWWGAWLSLKNSNKIVISPKNYHSEKNILEYKDIYPDDWIIL